MKVFLNDWADTQLDGVKGDFWPGWRSTTPYAGQLDNVTALFASYSYENYSGDAIVIFERDGKLYEVNGSHCSCYGLEDQWDEEETTIEALRHRLDEGNLGDCKYSGNIFAAELRTFLDALSKREGESK